MITTEKRFEADIESFFLSPAGGYTKGADTYDAKQGLYARRRDCSLSCATASSTVDCVFGCAILSRSLP